MQGRGKKITVEPDGWNNIGCCISDKQRTYVIVSS